MKSAPVKYILLLLALIGLLLSITASFCFFETEMVEIAIPGGIRGHSHREYPLVIASLGFAVFAGACALGAAVVQAAEIRARTADHGSRVPDGPRLDL